jgi:Double zinc ribbon
VPTGRFCVQCGASLEGGVCAVCRAQLEPGAKFCHRCGTAAGAPPPLISGLAGSKQLVGFLPLGVAALAIVALIAFIAGRSIGGGPAQDTPATDQGASAEAPPDASAGGPVAEGGAIRAPDISSLSPRERADRLFDRVMRLDEEGKRDSVEFFAPMVMAAYQMLGPLDLDQHYDLGRIGEVTGAATLARAEADTILRANPTHLLGLALAARVAVDARQTTEARSYYRRLVGAAKAERAKNLPEYERHRHDIDTALTEARQLGLGSP